MARRGVAASVRGKRLRLEDEPIGGGALLLLLQHEPLPFRVRALDPVLGVAQRVAGVLHRALRREPRVLAPALLRLGQRRLRLGQRLRGPCPGLVRGPLLRLARDERVGEPGEEVGDRGAAGAGLVHRSLQLLDLVQRRGRVLVPALELVDDPEQRLHDTDPIRQS